MTTTFKPGRNEPFVVSSFLDAGKYEFLPFSQPEQERAQGFITAMLSTFHFRTGSHLLVLSQQDTVNHFLPIERAAMDYGLIVCNADDSMFDVRRTESILRRFDVTAAVAVSGEVLDGLRDSGFDAAELFRDVVVWAYPDAAARLDSENVRQFMVLGPATALGCQYRNGLHLDPREWLVECVDGEILLTSKQPRSMDFEGFATGVKAELHQGVCACGNTGPRIVLK